MPQKDIMSGYRPRSWLIGAESGEGKTHFMLDVGNYLKDRMTEAGVPVDRMADNIAVAFVAGEDGAAPLVRRGVFPPELRSSFRYFQCGTWTDVKTDTKAALEWIMMRQQMGVPIQHCWLLFDNIHNAWSWLQDEFSNEIYGMSLKQLATLKRKQAQAEHKANLPTFNRMLDYAIMNPEYSEWFNLFHPIGGDAVVNYMMTCPVWLQRERSDPNDRQSPMVIVGVDPKCQPDTIFRCDEFMWIQKDEGEGNARRLSLRKSRCSEKTFNGLPEPSVRKLIKFYEKFEKVV